MNNNSENENYFVDSNLTLENLPEDLTEFLRKIESKKKINENINELNEYRTLLEGLIQKDSNKVFGNSSDCHAAIVLSTILKHSNNHVIIYDNDLSGDIANLDIDFYYQIYLFLKRNGKLDILINKSDVDGDVFEYLKLLKKKYNLNGICVKQFSDEIETNKSVNKLKFFAVGDNKSYRIEEASVSSNRKAHCSFNGQRVAKNLVRLFEYELGNREITTIL